MEGVYKEGGGAVPKRRLLAVVPAYIHTHTYTIRIPLEADVYI